MYQYFKSFLVFLVVVTFIGSCSQPEPEDTNSSRRKSPIAIAKTIHQPTNTYMKVVYGQPYKNGRTIFGKLVPYDNVWRTGANEATELTTTRTIQFGGEELKAGTYTLFSIPKEEGPWTIILNNKLGQWGAFDYQRKFDKLRIKASAAKKESATEAFTIKFTEISGDSTNITLQWDHTEVTIPVIFKESNMANAQKGT